MQKLIKIFQFLTVTCFFILTSYAECLLPPLYQSIREYTALLNSPELASHLGSSQIILNIQRQDSGFIVQTSHNRLEAKVIYEPMDHAGPAKFHFEFSPIEE